LSSSNFNPQDNEVRRQSPERVIVWYAQELETRLSTLRVLDAGGFPVDRETVIASALMLVILASAVWWACFHRGGIGKALRLAPRTIHPHAEARSRPSGWENTMLWLGRWTERRTGERMSRMLIQAEGALCRDHRVQCVDRESHR
jgi:hypothetical protein